MISHEGPRRVGLVTASVAVMFLAVIAAVVLLRNPPMKDRNSQLILDALDATMSGGPAFFSTQGVFLFQSGDTQGSPGLEGVVDPTHQSIQLDDSTGMTVRLIGDSVYIQSPLLDLSQGAQWVEAKAEDLHGLFWEQLLNGAADPIARLRLLRAIRGKPIEEGPETISNVRTTRYSCTLDIKRLLTGPERHEIVPYLTNYFEVWATYTDLSQVPIQVWLDDAGRVHRFVVSLRIGEDGTEVMTTTLSGFGATKPVRPPDHAVTVPVSGVKDPDGILSGP